MPFTYLQWLVGPEYMCMLSHAQLFATSWTVAHQAPLSKGFSMQENWSGLPFPPPGNFPDPGIKSISSVSSPLAGGFFTTATWETQIINM